MAAAAPAGCHGHSSRRGSRDLPAAASAGYSTYATDVANSVDVLFVVGELPNVSRGGRPVASRGALERTGQP